MKKTDNKLRGFTLIELLTVIAIVAVLAAILIPAVGMVRQKAGTAETVSNLRQLYGAMQLYANEKGNKLPVPKTLGGTLWNKDVLFPYMFPEVANPEWSDLAGTVFTSPNAPDIGQKDNENAPAVSNAANQGFGMNTHLPSFADIPANANFGEGREPALVRLNDLSRTMLLMDCNAQTIIGQDYYLQQFTTYVSNRHNGNNTVLFCDGHVETIPHERFSSTSTDPLMPFNAALGTSASLFWRGK